MVEYLALPAWNTPETTVDAWVVALSESAGPVIVSREGPGVAWLEVAPMRLRGYVVIEGGHAAAINFEVHDPDHGPSTRALEAASVALGWELHPDDEDEDEDEDEAEEDDR